MFDTSTSDTNTVVLATVLRVTNLERSHKWYHDLLGFAVEFRDPKYRITQYRTPCGVPIAIWELRSHETLNPACLNGAYIVFRTENLSRERDALIRLGVSVGEIEQGEGVQVLWFTDPDGNRFCMLQFLPD